jgi:nucleotide-binding universal stress UspA family protein
MIHTILVPLDGTNFGEHALPLALSIARRARGRVELVHVHQPVLMVHGEAATEDRLDPVDRAHEQLYLDEVAGRAKYAAADLEVKATLLDGPIVDAVQRHCAAHDVDLIVLATHGRGPLSRLLTGSVADDLLRHAPRPLLLVRTGEEAVDLNQEFVFPHMVIPLDGTDLAEQVLIPASALAHLMVADVTLVEAIPPVFAGGYDAGILMAPPPNVAEVTDCMKESAEKYLGEVATRLRAEGLKVTIHIAVEEHAVEGILEAIEGKPNSLVALATHGRGGLSRMLLGSVADKLVRSTTVPVLVCRALP